LETVKLPLKILKPSFCAFFILFLAGQNPVFTQNLTVNSSIVSFSDQTYVTFGQGLGNRVTPTGVKKLEPILFEGQMAPLFSLQFRKRVPFGFALCPKIVFRMYNEYSYPVRTPSYMPFLLIYHRVKFPFLKRYNVFKPFLKTKPTFFNTYKYGHHSNGQNGEYFVHGTKQINYENGNFATDYTEVATSFLSGDTIHNNLDLLSGRFAFEHHLGLNREDSMYNTYYYEKLSLELRFLLFKKITLCTGFSAMFGREGFRPNYASDTYISYRPLPHISDISIFANLYFGPDYYNLRYENNMSFISFGLLLEPKALAIIKKK
jgi:hypothetical protein